ncbi:MarR family transcriptional regulator [Wukongibacter baidiensis]|uniref:MarR family winged helix-turn-helix transcriptional regulator n=1 Tax=Wukongibacter baidiensis TaxID=1723361 RepID=UPI003D7F523A
MLKKIFEDIYYYLDDELTKKAMAQFNIEDLSKISINHLDYLEVINKKGKPTLGEIAAELEYAKPSVTTMVNKLIKQGFVRKVQSDEDKRVFYVELTDLGKALVEVQLSVYREFANDLEKILEEDEVERLSVLLNKGLNAIKRK